MIDEQYPEGLIKERFALCAAIGGTALTLASGLAVRFTGDWLYFAGVLTGAPTAAFGVVYHLGRKS